MKIDKQNQLAYCRFICSSRAKTGSSSFSYLAILSLIGSARTASLWRWLSSFVLVSVTICDAFSNATWCLLSNSIWIFLRSVNSLTSSRFCQSTRSLLSISFASVLLDFDSISNNFFVASSILRLFFFRSIIFLSSATSSPSSLSSALHSSSLTYMAKIDLIVSAFLVNLYESSGVLGKGPIYKSNNLIK